MSHVWKQLEEFPEHYISDGGQVINLRTGHLLRPYGREESPFVYINNEGVRTARSIKKLLRKYY